MSEPPQTHGRKSRFPLIAAVVLGGMLISYTVVRLRHMSKQLPYDPGPPLRAVDVAPGTVLETLGNLRDTFLSRKSARVTAEPEQLHECWPLTGIEYERAVRILESMQAKDPGPLCDALTSLVDAKRAFVLEQDLFPLAIGEEWKVWTHELFEKNGRRRILVVPIDLREFPQVR